MRKCVGNWSTLALLLVVFVAGCCKNDGNVLGIPTVIPRGGVPAPVPLGTINTGGNDFRVLAGTTVTNTGLTVVTGDVGVWPGSAVTGFGPGTMTGNGGLPHAGDAVAQAAQASLTVAFNDAAGRAPGASVAGNIGGLTLAPGTYTSTSSLAISSGDLTLDARGNSSAVFLFQIPSALTVTTGRKVILTGGALASNVFWQVGSSATLGTNSNFSGTIMADISISLLTGATLHGRALARNGAVSLDTNPVGP
jgi:ice-binding like protein